MKKTIIFDMDGTLIKSINLYKEAHVEMFKKRSLDLKGFHNSAFDRHKGGKTIELMSDFAEYFKEKVNLEVSAEELLAEQDDLVFGEHGMYKDRVEMHQGAINLLKKLKSRNIKIALATTARMKTVKIVFEKFDLYKYFDVLVTAEDVEKGKPDPEIYELAFQRLKEKVDFEQLDEKFKKTKSNKSNKKDLEKKDCLVIEDHENGVASAIAANVDVVAVRHDSEKEFENATYVVKDFNDDFILKFFYEKKPLDYFKADLLTFIDPYFYLSIFLVIFSVLIIADNIFSLNIF